jgi:hypothetical protein
MEKQRFYRMVTKQARFGGRGEAHEIYAMLFRADNLREATAHAKHCIMVDKRARCLGLDIDYVQFLGTTEPAEMGEIKRLKDFGYDTTPMAR